MQTKIWTSNGQFIVVWWPTTYSSHFSCFHLYQEKSLSWINDISLPSFSQNKAITFLTYLYSIDLSFNRIFQFYHQMKIMRILRIKKIYFTKNDEAQIRMIIWHIILHYAKKSCAGLIWSSKKNDLVTVERSFYDHAVCIIIFT